MKKLILLLIICKFIISETITDDFNRSSLGSDWTTITNAMTIRSSDTLAGTVNSAVNGCYYNAIETADSQSVSAILKYGSDVTGTYVGARIQSGAASGYAVGYWGNKGNLIIARFTNGSRTNLRSKTVSDGTSGQRIAILCRNDTIFSFRAGVAIDTAKDTTYSSGYGGVIQLLNTTTPGYYDDYEYHDNNNPPVECDTSDAIVYDSTTSSLKYKVFSRCDNTDSLGFVYALDTLTPLDTIWYTGSYADGDSAVASIANLNPSTKYWYAAIDSIKKSIWQFAYTRDDTDSVVIDSASISGKKSTGNNRTRFNWRFGF